MRLVRREYIQFPLGAYAACLLVWVSSAAAQTAQQGPTQATCPNPPAFAAPTYEEDDSYLANPQCRTSWLDTLKYIPLGTESPNYYVSFGL